MDIQQAVVTCMRKYFTFSGRAGRWEFWWFFFNFAVIVVFYNFLAIHYFLEPLMSAIYDHDIGSIIFFGILYNLPLLVLITPFTAVTTRRLHDVGKSGWWQLIDLIPWKGLILILVWCAFKTKPEGDKYGEAPAET